MTTQPSDKLRVFLSWSLQRSEAIAQAFRDWLPSVLQNVRPYYTPDDIGKGSRWASEIRGELEGSDFGIIFLTPENLTSPWILFEAGALSKLEKSKVAPLLLGVDPTDVSGPLAQLQLTKFNKEECFKLIKALNRALDTRALEPAVLTNVFDKWWPDLEAKVQAAMAIALPSPHAAKRPERELLEEVLERVRAIQMRPSGGIAPHRRPIPPAELAARGPSDVSLRELGLSGRTYVSMREFGLRSLADLIALTEYDLIRIPNFGKSSLLEVRHTLERYGLQLQQGDNGDAV
ncbi:DNA-directed RNA polymerase subunit alpha C-terminal domain-containing protein [Xanthomonas campestris]|uniref:DNA-directed RNA polymerase subunit alpha C-terminal domain-containing protein n=1 Tax=Xanthomonas campestris TaxID=339 RepID=UPI00388DFF8B